MTTLTPEKEAEARAAFEALDGEPHRKSSEWVERWGLPLLEAYATERQAREAAEKEVERLTLQLETTQMQRDSRKLEAEHQGRYRLAAEAKLAALVELIEHAGNEQDRLRANLNDITWTPTREHYIDAVSTMGAFAGAIQARCGLMEGTNFPTEEGGELKPCRHFWNTDAEPVKCALCNITRPTQAPQDVAGLVEGAAAIIDPKVMAWWNDLRTGAGEAEADRQFGSRRRRAFAIAEQVLALRPSPISHETKALEPAAADNNREAEIPDFLKRQTGELPPATFPTWGEDDGREGRRLGAEEDSDNNPPASVAEAFRKGAMAALGCARWDDADDFFTLVGLDYAQGKPFPPTMPKPQQPADNNHKALVEEKAQAIYAEWADQQGFVPWVPGGNSHMQDAARQDAQKALASAKPPQQAASAAATNKEGPRP